MLPTIIVGLIFAGIVTWSFIRTRRSMKAGKCAGCGVEGCSSRKK